MIEIRILAAKAQIIQTKVISGGIKAQADLVLLVFRIRPAIQDLRQTGAAEARQPEAARRTDDEEINIALIAQIMLAERIGQGDHLYERPAGKDAPETAGDPYLSGAVIMAPLPDIDDSFSAGQEIKAVLPAENRRRIGGFPIHEADDFRQLEALIKLRPDLIRGQRVIE